MAARRAPNFAFSDVLGDLERSGWYDLTPDSENGVGRIVVKRFGAAGYVQGAEILRSADGRSWVIYADSQCPSCGREARIARRLQGTEIDLAAAVETVVDELGAFQHDVRCSNRADKAREVMP